MFGFSSYYWNVAELAEADRRSVEALDTLSPSLPSAGYATYDGAGLLAAYRALLRSTDIRARGVALDQYAYTEAQHRWGVENPFAGLADEVLERARELLATAADPAVPLSAQRHVVACWNSALAVMAVLSEGGAVDMPRIIEVLDAALPDSLLDVHALWALRERLVDADPATCARVGAWLTALFTDETLPVRVRTMVVDVCRVDGIPARLGLRDALADLLGHTDLRLSTTAAMALLAAGWPHDEALRRAVAGWPDDAPYPADEVRERLAEADQLVDARATNLP